MTMPAPERVYRQYDQAGLDAEYDNVRKHPRFDFKAYLANLNALNEQALKTWQGGLKQDVRYGAHPDQTMDLFLVHPNAPLHVFFHGGYWRMLHKNDFSYVASGIVPHGVNLAIVNYSLIPETNMEGLVGQCVRSVQWLLKHHRELSIDPGRVSVSGHSAGGHLAAMIAATPFEFPQSGGGFSHVCSLSGIFDLEPIRRSFLQDTLGLSDRDVALFSPLHKKRIHVGPMSVVTGAAEGDEYERQARSFVEAWSAQGPALELMFPATHDHFTLRAALADPESVITRLVLNIRD